MSAVIEEQAFALMAAYHAAIGVNALAQKGQWAQENFAAILPSLQRFDALTVADYYQHYACFAPAREAMVETFAHGVPDEHLRYLMQVLSVERRLAKNASLMAVLKAGLLQAVKQVEHFGLLHDNVFARYADIYQQTASQAARKILVRGHPQYLQQANTVAQIRTLLLCGIRAASLWRGAGGSRSQIMFGRRALVDAAQALSL